MLPTSKHIPTLKKQRKECAKPWSEAILRTEQEVMTEMERKQLDVMVEGDTEYRIVKGSRGMTNAEKKTVVKNLIAKNRHMLDSEESADFLAERLLASLRYKIPVDKNTLKVKAADL